VSVDESLESRERAQEGEPFERVTVRSPLHYARPRFAADDMLTDDRRSAQLNTRQRRKGKRGEEREGNAPLPLESERTVLDARLPSKPGVDAVPIVARENLEFVLDDLVVCVAVGKKSVTREKRQEGKTHSFQEGK
jgi:hypothetical protein